MAKHALCVGINAYSNSPLQGCVNDANDWTAELVNHGFTVITLRNAAATRNEILGQIVRVLDACTADDLAVVTYSGHGTQVPDLDGDEIDRLDEAIVPVDYPTAGMITDDQLFDLFAPAYRRGVRVIFIADSCFSGTIQRFAPPLVDEYTQVEEPHPRHARWLPPAVHLPPTQLATVQRLAQLPKGTPRTSALAFTASRDNQVAYDAWLDDRYRGAFTAAALTALGDITTRTSRLRNTYRDWYLAIRRHLPSVDFDQVPQLDGTSSQKRWLLFEEQGRR